MGTQNDEYSSDEIYEMLKSSNLNDEFKTIILCRFKAMVQAMYNAVHRPDVTMTISDPFGSIWIEEHNRVVTEYQRFHL